MDSMSKDDLAPGLLAVSNSKVATEEGQRPGRVDQAKPQHHKGNTWFLALTAIGIVYGDIGTSPLYAFSVALNATGHRPPLASDIIGIVSLTFWALLLMVSLKYVVFVLRADNDGEGGILALLALVASDKIADARFFRRWRGSNWLHRPSRASSCRSRSLSWLLCSQFSAGERRASAGFSDQSWSYGS
jgi:K+ potassium transporter